MGKNLPVILGAGIGALAAVTAAFLTLYESRETRYIVAAMSSTSPGGRAKAVEMLVAKGDDALPLLKRLLSSGSTPQVCGAGATLLKMKDTWRKLLPQMLAVMRSKPSPATDAIAAVFDAKKYDWENKFDFDAPERRNMLAFLLRYKEKPETRAFAAGALGEIGDTSVVPFLTGTLLADNNASVREQAAVALGVIGNADAVEPLSKALGTDSSPGVRLAAAAALGDIANAAGIPALAKAMSGDADLNVKMKAEESLRKFRGRDAVAALTAVLKDISNEELELLAVDVLAETGGPEAVAALLDMLGNGESYSAMQAADALYRIADGNSSDTLAAALRSHENPYARALAAELLAGTGRSDAAFDALATALEKDKSGAVRARAASTLAGWGKTRAIERLIDVFERDTSTDVRAAATEGFSAMPDGFPKADCDAADDARAVAAAEMRHWLEKYHARLHWSEPAQKFSILPPKH